MSSFDREMAQRVAAETAEREQAEKNVEAQEKRAKFEEYERMEKLLNSADVKWLLRQFQMRVDHEHDTALSIAISPEEAEKARHRHAVAKELCDLLPNRFTELKNRIFEEKALTSAV